MNYAINDILKCYDFSTTDTCYMIGMITEINEQNKTITLKTIKKVFNGDLREDLTNGEFDAHEPEETFTTPMLGYGFDDEYGKRYVDIFESSELSNDLRIVKILEAEEVELLAEMV